MSGWFDREASFNSTGCNESIIVVRTAADQIKAFLNVCQHRGRRFTAGFGRTKCVHVRLSRLDVEARRFAGEGPGAATPAEDPGVRERAAALGIELKALEITQMQ